MKCGVSEDRVPPFIRSRRSKRISAVRGQSELRFRSHSEAAPANEPRRSTGAALLSPLIILPLRANQRKPVRVPQRRFRISGAVYLSAVRARGAAPYGAVSHERICPDPNPPHTHRETYPCMKTARCLSGLAPILASPPPPPSSHPLPTHTHTASFFPAWMEERIWG